MGLLNTTPMPWTPQGLSDTLDATNTPTGLMASLSNLVPDQTTRGVWVCRPASFLQTSFASFNTPAFVSCIFVIGSRVYGLVASAAFAGHDEPFCWDTATSAFVAVGGAVLANTPVSPATAGAWTPPRAALVGTKIVFTHPGFAGTANKIGFIDVSVVAAPVWSAGTTAPQALADVPVDVFNFNGRAYYAVNTATSTALQYSDVLTPQTITNANQVLTLDDTVPVTALGGVPLSSPLQGGAIQSLIVFKGVTSMYQVLGDAALGTLARDKLAVPTGTLAANSVCPTPMGLAFMSPEGLRLVGPDGNITTPIGVDGQGIAVPFQYAVVPSRIAAACNGNTIRISVQNGYIATQPSQEFWFDLARKNWSGPHTFAASLIAALSNTFIKTAVGVNAKLFTSDVRQSSTSGYVENGTQLTWSWATPLLPDLAQMSEMGIIESTIDMQYPAGVPSFLGIAYDQNGTLYDTVFLAPGGVATFWGGFLWGAAVWFGTPNALISRPLNWHKALVFRRIAFGASGQSAGDFKVGTLRLRIEALGYLQQTAGT